MVQTTNSTSGSARTRASASWPSPEPAPPTAGYPSVASNTLSGALPAGGFGSVPGDACSRMCAA